MPLLVSLYIFSDGSHFSSIPSIKVPRTCCFGPIMSPITLAWNPDTDPILVEWDMPSPLCQLPKLSDNTALYAVTTVNVSVTAHFWAAC
jgi:hypothetical protein